MKWLLDTNVVSELMRVRPDAGVRQWAESLDRVAISVVTIEEMTFGLTWHPNPRIESFVRDFFDYDCEALPVTRAIAQRAGEMRGALQRKGKTRGQSDLLIAATAAVHGLTLVTRNTRHFDDLFIALFNPFTS